jgi:hypothetical protein
VFSTSVLIDAVLRAAVAMRCDPVGKLRYPILMISK